MKQLRFSRTIWLAVLQGVIGILVAINTEMPEANIAGLILMMKSVADIVIRLDTREGIDRI